MRYLFLAAGLFIGAASAALAAEAAATRARVYRIELVGGGIVWSDDAPLLAGDQIVFHGHPAGPLKSLRRSDVQRIVATSAVVPASPQVRPGETVDLGATGGRGGARGTPARPGRPADAGTRPGEAKDGTALFNPDRTYKPDWDSKLVPGSTMGYPNSPNDYREGRTLAYPPAAATQSAPGEPPTMKPSSGEPPKSPNN